MAAIADPLREYADNLANGRVDDYEPSIIAQFIHAHADQIDHELERQMVELLRHECSIAHKITHGTGEYGHTTCSACGVTVHRRDKWCWSCGARLSGKLEVRKC